MGQIKVLFPFKDGGKSGWDGCYYQWSIPSAQKYWG